MNIPKFSFIIPVYNAEHFLPRCIDSILNQSFPDFEILLIDDGSTDKSASICDEYSKQDSRIHVIHQPNSGVSSARNIGIEKAKGEWIWFVDSDDYILNNSLYKISQYLNDNSNYDLYLFSYKEIRGNKQRNISYKETELTYKDFAHCLFRYTYKPAPWCYIIKSETIKKHTFHKELKIGEDFYFLFSYLSKNMDKRIRVSDLPIYAYYINSFSVLQSSKTNRVLFYSTFVDTIYSFLRNDNLLDAFAKDFYQFSIISLTQSLLMQKCKYKEFKSNIRIVQEKLIKSYKLSNSNDNFKKSDLIIKYMIEKNYILAAYIYTQINLYRNSLLSH